MSRPPLPRPERGADAVSEDWGRKASGGNGHPGYIQILGELEDLHVQKSAGYGTSRDPFENFSAVARAKGQPRFVYPLDRDLEKTIRCYSLLEQLQVGSLEEEFLDKASLMICAAALLRDDASV